MTETNPNLEEMWFYALLEKQFGPVPGDRIIELFHEGTIDPSTKVWTGSMEEWAPFETTSLFEKCRENVGDLRPKSPPPLPFSNTRKPEHEHEPEAVDNEFKTKIESYYRNFLILMIIGLCLMPLLGIGLIPIIAASVFALIILYRSWGWFREMTFGVAPIVAIVLLFVPLGSTIWAFWAYYYFSKRINEALFQQGKSKILNEDTALIYCLFSIVSDLFVNLAFIPHPATIIIGLLILMIDCAIFIFVIRGICKGMILLNTPEEEPTGPLNIPRFNRL